MSVRAEGSREFLFGRLEFFLLQPADPANRHDSQKKQTSYVLLQPKELTAFALLSQIHRDFHPPPQVTHLPVV